MLKSEVQEATARALVVDDDAISRHMIAFALQQENFTCDSARDGIEAIGLLGLNPYDVLVTDLQMPTMNGFELVRELMESGSTPLVIVHTSVIDPAVARDLIAAGVDDIVFKPVDYAAFASKTRALFARRETQRKLRDTPRQNPMHSTLSDGNSESLSCVFSPPGIGGHVEEIPNYRIGRFLGAGTMGEVYEADHILLNRRCAIKFIRPDALSDELMRRRFTMEVRSAAKISHRNHVQIFDFGVTRKGHFYCAMELIQGCTLQELVENHGPLLPSRVIHFLIQACDGLEEAHRLGMIHRDLKPSNLMATQRDHQLDVLKILDFGLVLNTVTDLTGDTILTQAGMMCGTPAFIAPEQIIDAAGIDLRADIYALGATAYFLLTGQPPFVGTSLTAVVCAHLHEIAVPPSEINSDVPHDLDGVIMRCLQKSANQRFQSATELAIALNACSDFQCWTEIDAATWWDDAAVLTSTSGESATSP